MFPTSLNGGGQRRPTPQRFAASLPKASVPNPFNRTASASTAAAAAAVSSILMPTSSTSGTCQSIASQQLHSNKGQSVKNVSPNSASKAQPQTSITSPASASSNTTNTSAPVEERLKISPNHDSTAAVHRSTHSASHSTTPNTSLQPVTAPSNQPPPSRTPPKVPNTSAHDNPRTQLKSLLTASPHSRSSPRRSPNQHASFLAGSTNASVRTNKPTTSNIAVGGGPVAPQRYSRGDLKQKSIEELTALALHLQSLLSQRAKEGSPRGGLLEEGENTEPCIASTKIYQGSRPLKASASPTRPSSQQRKLVCVRNTVVMTVGSVMGLPPTEAARKEPVKERVKISRPSASQAQSGKLPGAPPPGVVPRRGCVSRGAMGSQAEKAAPPPKPAVGIAALMNAAFRLKGKNAGVKAAPPLPKAKAQPHPTLQLYWPPAAGSPRRVSKTTEPITDDPSVHRMDSSGGRGVNRSVDGDRPQCPEVLSAPVSGSVFDSDTSDEESNNEKTPLTAIVEDQRLKEWFARKAPTPAATSTAPGDTLGKALSKKRESVLGKAASQKFYIRVNFLKKAFEAEGGWTAFKHAILSCRLDTNQINLLIDTVPEPDLPNNPKLAEWQDLVEKVNHFRRLHPNEPLQQDEEFVYYISSIPNLHRRLQCMLIMASFEEVVNDVVDKMECLDYALQLLVSHRKIRKLFKAILHVGNALNGGTPIGNRKWFRLSTLAKISELRGVGRSGKSLLYFIALHLGPVLTHEEFGILQKAAKLTIVQTYIQIYHIVETCKAISDESAAAAADANGGSSSSGLRKKRRDSVAPDLEDSKDRFAEVAFKFVQENANKILGLSEMINFIVKKYEECVTYFGDPESFLKIDRKVEDESHPGQKKYVTDIFGVMHNFFSEYQRACREIQKDKEKEKAAAAAAAAAAARMKKLGKANDDNSLSHTPEAVSVVPIDGSSKITDLHAPGVRSPDICSGRGQFYNETQTLSPAPTIEFKAPVTMPAPKQIVFGAASTDTPSSTFRESSFSFQDHSSEEWNHQVATICASDITSKTSGSFEKISNENSPSRRPFHRTNRVSLSARARPSSSSFSGIPINNAVGSAISVEELLGQGISAAAATSNARKRRESMNVLAEELHERHLVQTWEKGGRLSEAPKADDANSQRSDAANQLYPGGRPGTLTRPRFGRRCGGSLMSSNAYQPHQFGESLPSLQEEKGDDSDDRNGRQL